jgi:ABC-type cobalamin/Fe3+-siderophores transport system ATPase subunit
MIRGLPAVALERVSLTYSRWGTKASALRDISLDIRAGSWTLVTGENGSGKSSLLRIIAGLAHPDQGSVELFGRSSEDLGGRERASLVACVHQRPEEGLAVGLTVGEHVTACGLSRESFHLRLGELQLETSFPFIRSAWRRPVESLSGGERQVFGIALQLLRGAPLLLLDEPFSALDHDRESRVLSALKLAAGEATIIQVTHDPDLLRSEATAEVRLHEGRLAEYCLLHV